MAGKLALIDGNALVHRAFHALPPLTSPRGELVNAVYGVATMLLKVLQEMRHSGLAIGFKAGSHQVGDVHRDRGLGEVREEQDLQSVRQPVLGDPLHGGDLGHPLRQGLREGGAGSCEGA